MSPCTRVSATGPWHIRAASHDEVEALAQRCRQDAAWHQHLVGYYTLQPDCDWRVYAHTQLARRNHVIFVADDGGHLRGFLAVGWRTVPGPGHRRSFWQRCWRRQHVQAALPLQPCAWGIIAACVVVDTHRRQGIGAALVMQALARCHGHGLSRVALGVLATNPPAQAFWTQHGCATYRLLRHTTLSAGCVRGDHSCCP